MKNWLVAYRIRYATKDGMIRDIIESDIVRNVPDDMLKRLYIMAFCEEKKKELEAIEFLPGMKVDNVIVLAITELE